MNTTLGMVIRGFLLEYLPQQKGLRESTVYSYRDTLRLFLRYVAADKNLNVSQLQLKHLTFEQVLNFLHDLEQSRHNSVSTRNQRLGALHTFYDYIARQVPEMLRESEKVATIPIKRVTLPDTRFMSRDEIDRLFNQLPDQGRYALRDRALLLFLYNTGARVQEVADLRVGHITFDHPPSVRLKGKGGKWRTCPLWGQTADVLAQLIQQQQAQTNAAVFMSAKGTPLTRFGIYKRVRKYAADIESNTSRIPSCRITPHVFRHSTAVHLLEAGVEVNVIRGWLGHVSLETTNRYAEITLRMKQQALKLCEPPADSDGVSQPSAWHADADLLTWLTSL